MAPIYELADKLTRFEQTRDELTEQYRLKTGSQLEAVARIAGVITQAPQHLIDAIAEYSRVFGIVFQIIDDLIDIQEGREKLGKHEGEGIRNSKLNMVLLHALSSLAGADLSRADLTGALLTPIPVRSPDGAETGRVRMTDLRRATRRRLPLPVLWNGLTAPSVG